MITVASTTFGFVSVGGGAGAGAFAGARVWASCVGVGLTVALELVVSSVQAASSVVDASAGLVTSVG